MIFSDGITESARKASVRNGVAPDQPSVAAASFVGEALRDHVGERSVGEEPGDGKRAFGDDAAIVDGDDAATDVGEVRDGDHHVLVAHPDDDEVVGVVGDRRGERPALQAGAGDEAEPDPSRCEVALDDGDLRQAASASATAWPSDDDGIALERLASRPDRRSARSLGSARRARGSRSRRP